MAHWRGGGVKKDKTDTVFSHLVRERVNFYCERCGICYRELPEVLHCSHLFGRARLGVRIHPKNAFSHCHKCHRHFEQYPVEFAEWAKEKLGQVEYERIRFLANKPTKISKFEKEIIHKHFLAEHKRMKRMRMDGEQGRINFDWPKVA